MAVMTLNYSSKTIGMHQNITIILPEDESFLMQVAQSNH